MARYTIHKKEETLDNGLHVILVHKPDYAKSLFLLAAPVGGYDIQQKINGEIITHPTGCAHFLEHKMFNYKGGDVTDEFARMQCSTNAYTSYNETAFYFNTTSDVKEPLKLLLDFVQNLNITQESVDKEKGIILSEYNMYQQNPETHLIKNTWDALYEKHPMHIDILGTPEDIENMKVEDLQRFYSMNYDPSRLTLVGITGRDLDEILEIVKEHQANVTSRMEDKVERYIPEEKKEVVQEEIVEEMDISVPYVSVAYKLNSFDDIYECYKYDFALSMAQDAIFSPLNPDYQKWMDDRIITQMFGAECDINTDHSHMMFYGQTEKVDEFVQIIEETVKKIQTELLDEKVVNSLKKRIVATNIRGLNYFDGLAGDLVRAHNLHYDFEKTLHVTEEFSPELVLSLMKNLDFSHKAIVKVCPKTSNEN